jgi:hypothetical protein
VITNNNYTDSLAYLNHLLATMDIASILQTDRHSLNRFSRAMIWATHFSPTSENEYNYAFRALRNVAQPSTFWSMTFALRPKVFSVSTYAAPQAKWVNLKDFDPSCSSGAKMLDLNANIAGDATAYFRDYTYAGNKGIIEQNTLISQSVKDIMQEYPRKMTHCLDEQ